jgi:S-formylglutathione hydrolase
MSEFEIKSKVKVFGGYLIRFSHKSSSTKTTMTAAAYIPTTDEACTTKFPYLLYLSGLTCTDENVCQKSGIFKYLAERKLAFIAPDTSPRGIEIEGALRFVCMHPFIQ